MKKILFIVGSSRNNGFNYQLSLCLKELIESKYEISYLDYSNLPFFNQDLENPELDIVKSLRKSLINTDGIVIFSPEYNLSYSGYLKNLLDWMSRPLVYNDFSSGTALLNKKVFITGIGGKNKTSYSRENLKSLLEFCNMKVIDSSIGFMVNNEAWVNNKVVLDNTQKEELNKLASIIEENI